MPVPTFTKLSDFKRFEFFTDFYADIKWELIEGLYPLLCITAPGRFNFQFSRYHRNCRFSLLARTVSLKLWWSIDRMRNLDLQAWHKAVSELIGHLDAANLQWNIVTEHRKFRAIIAETTGKMLSPQFDHNYFDFTRDNWYGIIVTDAKGRCVSTVAGRRENIGSLTLAEHWGSADRPGQQSRLYSDGTLGSDHAPTAHAITGTVVYCGEMWVAAPFRDVGLGSVIARLNHIVGFLQLRQPDYMYALLNAELVRERWGFAAGFATTEPVGVDWQTQPKGGHRTEYLCCNSRSQIIRLIMATAAGDVGFNLMQGAERLSFGDGSE